jgi:hypothetical protein
LYSEVATATEQRPSFSESYPDGVAMATGRDKKTRRFRKKNRRAFVLRVVTQDQFVSFS